MCLGQCLVHVSSQSFAQVIPVTRVFYFNPFPLFSVVNGGFPRGSVQRDFRAGKGSFLGTEQLRARFMVEFGLLL